MTHIKWLTFDFERVSNLNLWNFLKFEFFQNFKFEVRLMSWSGPRVLMDIHFLGGNRRFLVQNLFLGKCKFCWSRRGWLLLFFVSTTQNGSRCIGTLFYPHSLFKVWKRLILSRHLYYFYCHVHKVAAKNETRIFPLQKHKKRSVSLFPKVLSKNTPIVWSSFPQLLQSKQLN